MLRLTKTRQVTSIFVMFFFYIHINQACINWQQAFLKTYFVKLKMQFENERISLCLENENIHW